MFKWYKQKKKIKIENNIRDFIKFNKYKTEYYKNYPKGINNPIVKFDNDCSIAKSYIKDACINFMDKYDINEYLVREQFKTHRIAIEEYHKMKSRVYQEKQQQEENEKIKLYKKAILELKKEGKI